MNLAERFLKGGLANQLFTTALCRITVAVASLVFSLIIARQLGPTATGTLFFALATVSCIGFIPRLGNDLNLVLYTSTHHPGCAFDKIYGYLLISSMIAVLLSLVIIFAVRNLDSVVILTEPSRHTYQYISAMLLALPAICLAAFLAGCLKGVGQPGRSTLLEQGGVFVPAVLAWILLYLLGTDPDLDLSVTILVTCFYLMAAVGLIWWFRIAPVTAGITFPALSETKHLLMSSFNMGLSGLLSYTSHWGNILLVGILANASQTGVYAVADRIATIQYFVLSIVYAVFFQRLSKLYNDKANKDFQKLSQRASLISTLWASPLLLMSLVWPKGLLSVFGHDFSNASLELQLLSLGYFSTTLLGSGAHVLIISGQERVLKNITLWSFALQLALALILIPLFGAKGAAAALLAAYLVRYMASIVAIRSHLGFYLYPKW